MLQYICVVSLLPYELQKMTEQKVHLAVDTVCAHKHFACDDLPTVQCDRAACTGHVIHTQTYSLLEYAHARA